MNHLENKELRAIDQDIESLKMELNELVKECGNLSDPRFIKISQRLDEKLNERKRIESTY